VPQGCQLLAILSADINFGGPWSAGGSCLGLAECVVPAGYRPGGGLLAAGTAVGCGQVVAGVSETVIVYQAYRFGLDPTPAVERDLARHAGAARFAFNWGLALVRACLAQRDAERTYGVAEEGLTPVPWTLFDLRRRWNRVKDHMAPWWPACSKEAYNSGLDALARALRGFSDSRAGRRAGRRVGFPQVQVRPGRPGGVPVHHRRDPGGGRP
jgi:hypothetical protein